VSACNVSNPARRGRRARFERRQRAILKARQAGFDFATALLQQRIIEGGHREQSAQTWRRQPLRRERPSQLAMHRARQPTFPGARHVRQKRRALGGGDADANLASAMIRGNVRGSAPTAQGTIGVLRRSGQCWAQTARCHAGGDQSGCHPQN